MSKQPEKARFLDQQPELSSSAHDDGEGPYDGAEAEPEQRPRSGEVVRIRRGKHHRQQDDEELDQADQQRCHEEVNHVSKTKRGREPFLESTDRKRLPPPFFFQRKPTLAPFLTPQLSPTVFYLWQKTFFENGAAAFEQAGRRRHPKQQDGKDRKIAQLEEKLVRKNEVVAELMEEHFQLKKQPGEP
jgi:hypothetical protein